MIFLHRSALVCVFICVCVELCNLYQITFNDGFLATRKWFVLTNDITSEDYKGVHYLFILWFFAFISHTGSHNVPSFHPFILSSSLPMQFQLCAPPGLRVSDLSCVAAASSLLQIQLTAPENADHIVNREETASWETFSWILICDDLPKKTKMLYRQTKEQHLLVLSAN